MTRPTVEVLRLLLATPEYEPLWVARIGERAALGKSTVSQILARLSERQWVVLRQEQGSHPGRPARVLCELTERGRREAETALAARGTGDQAVPGAPTVTAGQTTPTRPGSARSSGSGPGLRLHSLVRLHEFEMRLKTAEARSQGVSEADAGERMAVLREALGALHTLNELLTREFLARSAVGSARREEHWDLMNGFLAEASEIRSKALRAHNY
ncbi:hypothetical protein OG196_42800 [Kitasatospora purpeofusca]|uniref:hypothetical protein n=1 Tax=Kitasatospora purpeofusca TaxID=67352 RepID=UPI002E116029|nr:hypothetical protein OG196_00125 [Kitasatospora purpeofusca]WSR45235.1 hypothetical protein OG196_42800 [Kitasatospora purpeofusca]